MNPRKKLFYHYLKTDFFIDIITLIPLHQLIRFIVSKRKFLLFFINNHSDIFKIIKNFNCF